MATNTQTPKVGPVVEEMLSTMVKQLETNDVKGYQASLVKYEAIVGLIRKYRKLHDETFDALQTAQSFGKDQPILKEVKRFIVNDPAKKRGRPAKAKVNPADLF